MSRLKGDHIQVGRSFQLNDNKEREEQEAREIILQAEQQARLIIGQAKVQAARLLDSAKKEAETIVGQSEACREEARQQGYNEGAESGYEVGLLKAQEETVRLLEGAQSILESAYQAEKQVLKAFQENASTLIRHVAEKILHQALTDDPEALFKMVEGAMESLHLSSKVRVVVGAETLERIQKHSTKTGRALSQMTRFEFVGDSQLDHMEIYILSTEGNFNLTPAVQVEKLLTPLTRSLPIEPPGESSQTGATPEEILEALTMEDPINSSLPEASIPMSSEEIEAMLEDLSSPLEDEENS
jgi:flagellar assembly protein FliH